MKRTVLLILAGLLVWAPGRTAFTQDSPEERITLTLEKSISLALSQNPSYLASQERVSAAQSRVLVGESGDEVRRRVRLRHGVQPPQRGEPDPL